jgi:hypothetical protein
MVILEKDIDNRNKEIINDVVLFINKELFEENRISYKMFKKVEDEIFKNRDN